MKKNCASNALVFFGVFMLVFGTMARTLLADDDGTIGLPAGCSWCYGCPSQIDKAHHCSDSSCYGFWCDSDCECTQQGAIQAGKKNCKCTK